MIIVTGAAGFIGSAVVWGLNRRSDNRILVVDRMNQPMRDDEKNPNLADLKFSDYIDADDFLGRIRRVQFDRGVESLIHLGAISSTTEKNADLLRTNNTEYTRAMAEFAVRAGVRFIYASSAATYGDGSQGYSDDPANLERLKPLNLYGESKHRFDLWAKQHRLFDRIVGLKYFNVFGPNEYHKADMRSVVLKAFEQIRDTGKVRLFKSHRKEYADGEQVRDFLYVKDAVDMTLFFLDRPAANGLFNIGSGETHTWNELVTPVFAALDLPVSIEYIDMPPDIRDKYQYHTLADLTHLAAAGFSDPVTSLDAAVREYVRDYLIPRAHLKP